MNYDIKKVTNGKVLFALGSLIAILVDNFIGIDIMMYTAYIVLAIITLSVLTYTFKNVIENKSSLISTLRGVGSFLMLFIILYFLSYLRLAILC